MYNNNHEFIAVVTDGDHKMTILLQSINTRLWQYSTVHSNAEHSFMH